MTFTDLHHAKDCAKSQMDYCKSQKAKQPDFAYDWDRDWYKWANKHGLIEEEMNARVLKIGMGTTGIEPKGKAVAAKPPEQLLLPSTKISDVDALTVRGWNGLRRVIEGNFYEKTLEDVAKLSRGEMFGRNCGKATVNLIVEILERAGLKPAKHSP